MQHLSLSYVYPTVSCRLFAMMLKVCPEPGCDTINRGTVSSFAKAPGSETVVSTRARRRFSMAWHQFRSVEAGKLLQLGPPTCIENQTLFAAPSLAFGLGRYRAVDGQISRHQWSFGGHPALSSVPSSMPPWPPQLLSISPIMSDCGT
jgi:hypothetical protein